MRLPHPLNLLSLPLAALALSVALGLGCAKDGLGTGTGQPNLVKASAGAPSGLETGSDSLHYPLGIPSALKGREVYTANCTSCHGTYLTGAEKAALEKESELASNHPEKGKIIRELEKDKRYPMVERKSGPDFYGRDWRFQRTPGQLFQLIAYGSAEAKPGDPSAGKLQHPGPSGKLGEGWIDHIKTQRGGITYAPGDPVPVWDAVYYVWSRSIAGLSPTRFKEVWDIYGQNCSVCHGDTAKGNGPLSRTLNPQPFNFQNRKAMAEQTDEFLFWRISEGGQFRRIPKSVQDTMSSQALSLYVHQWSAMPSWRGILTEEQRWMLVDGVRSKTYEHE